MPNTDNTYADRLGRARQMQAAIALFVPPFAPTDPTLTPAAFALWVADLTTFNDEINAKTLDYTSAAQSRQQQAEEIKNTALRVLNLARANSNWAIYLPGVKSTADKLRGYRPRAPKPPAATDAEASPAAQKARSLGAQSYSDMEAGFRALIAAVKDLPGYAPAIPGLTIAELEAQAEAFSAVSATLNTLERDLSRLSRERVERFKTNPDSLRGKFNAIKATAQAQYGSKSAQYINVKLIPF